MEARLRSLAFTTNYTHVSPSRKVFPSNRSFLIVTGPTISNRVAFFILLGDFKSWRFFFSLFFSFAIFFLRGIVKESRDKGWFDWKMTPLFGHRCFKRLLEGEMKRKWKLLFFQLKWNSRFVEGFPFVASTISFSIYEWCLLFLQGIILTKLSEEMFVNFQSFLITFCLNWYNFYEIECENRIVAAIFIRVLKRRVESVVSSSITWNNLDYFFLLLLFLFLFQLFETKPIEERIIK